jgi:hypothetical protein
MDKLARGCASASLHMNMRRIPSAWLTSNQHRAWVSNKASRAADMESLQEESGVSDGGPRPTWKDYKKKKAVYTPDEIASRFPPYQIPNHILDLDAEGCPIVRSIEEEEGQRSSKDPDQELSRRIEKYEDDLVEADRYWHNNACTIEDHHILSAALRGGPTNEETDPHAADLPKGLDESVLLQNGIPRIVWDDDEKLLLWMLARRNKSRKGKTTT